MVMELKGLQLKVELSKTFCNKISLEQDKFQLKELNQVGCQTRLLLPMLQLPKLTILSLLR